ncbi:MAG: hypothetical protein H7249_13420 [Chitinophagaceae bacterium]|nr:hypothetical protein [Oligoflexus sp.]
MNLSSLLSMVFVLVNLFSARAVIAQEDIRDLVVEKVFEYGGACAQLAQLTRVELTGVTHVAYSEQFFEFCKADNVYRCEDYNTLLAGMGTLEDNGQSSCRYLPR